MAFRILRLCGQSVHFLKAQTLPNNGYLECSSAIAFNFLKPNLPQTSVNRSVSFFNKLPAEALWKGVTSVSNAGKRRGRAKSLVRKRDLNRGQYLGCGKANIMFPGLNSPAMRGLVVLQQCEIKDGATKLPESAATHDYVSGSRRRRQHPLERGWTSAKFGGRKIGPPESSIPNETFDGFETWILESKLVSNMTGNLGRKSRAAVFVITGNGNGLAGFSLAKATDHRQAAKLSKNKAGKKLMYIKRHEEHTVLHDFYGQFGPTKVFGKKMHKGYGLKCHRVLKACCEAIGIKDLYVKAEGPMNTQNLVKAFFIALLQQKTYQEIADETKLHIVEVRSETGNYPKVLASPAQTLKAEEIDNKNQMDFTQYVLGGNIVLQKQRKVPFYTKLPFWEICLRRKERVRNHDKVRLRLRSEYGELRSFLADQYPEARVTFVPKPEGE